jgi:hypothetical protein
MEHIIPEFPEYKINVHGEVFSRYKFKTGIVINEWRPIKSVLDKGVGYYLVTLVNANTKVRKNKFIHRLLGEAFIPNPENKAHINHIDGDKTNNCLTNLEWATPKENSQHAIRLGLTTYTSIEKRVLQFTGDGKEFIREFKSMKEAMDVTGVQQANISKVVRGIRPRAGGFHWKYK